MRKWSVRLGIVLVVGGFLSILLYMRLFALNDRLTEHLGNHDVGEIVVSFMNKQEPQQNDSEGKREEELIKELMIAAKRRRYLVYCIIIIVNKRAQKKIRIEYVLSSFFVFPLINNNNNNNIILIRDINRGERHRKAFDKQMPSIPVQNVLLLDSSDRWFEVKV